MEVSLLIPYEQALALWRTKRITTAAELQEAGEGNALTAAACCHAKLENIHPFTDGNGRTGRLIAFLKEQTARTWAKQIERAPDGGGAYTSAGLTAAG